MKPAWLRRAMLALAVSLSGTMSVQAGIVPEVESNDTLATAQVVAATATAQTVINGERSFNDPSDDFFRFFVPAFTSLSILSTSPDAFADSIMGLYDPNGTLIASNDDAAAGSFMSGLSYLVGGGMGSFYTIGFSGFNPGLLSCGAGVTACYDTDNDFVFDTFVAGGGAGGSTGWLYGITIDQVALAVPEPPLGLLVAAGVVLVALGRRRREPHGATPMTC